MPQGSLASKVIKSRRTIFLTKRKPSKSPKESSVTKTEYEYGGPMPAIDTDKLASDYPNDLSKEWYSKINQHYDSEDKGMLSRR